TNSNIISIQKQGIKALIVKDRNIFKIDDENKFWENNTLIEVLNHSKTIFYNCLANNNSLHFMFSNSLYSYELNSLKKPKKLTLPTIYVGKYFYIKDSTFLLSTHTGLMRKIGNKYERLFGERIYATIIDSKNKLWYTSLDGIFVINNFTSGNLVSKKISFKETKNVFVNEYKEDANGNMIMA
ncbi:hypothetical protein DI09_564p10, partial [Mitosporidium daphniae]